MVKTRHACGKTKGSSAAACSGGVGGHAPHLLNGWFFKPWH
jgi:hypothetical protein